MGTIDDHTFCERAPREHRVEGPTYTRLHSNIKTAFASKGSARPGPLTTASEFTETDPVSRPEDTGL